MRCLIKMNLVIALSGLFIQCDDNICLKAKGPILQENRVVAEFYSVEIRGSADLFITQDPDQSVIVEAQENILPRVETFVSNETLIIDLEGCLTNNQGVKVFVHMEDVQNLRIEGSGNIKNENLLESEKIDLRIKGSGEIDLELRYNELETDISGSGDIELTGEAGLQSIDIDGSGDYSCFALESDTCNIVIDGSGDCRVTVHELLNVEIYGSGNVYYKGNPSEIYSIINGSGSLIKAD